jgi:hypothetical protein
MRRRVRTITLTAFCLANLFFLLLGIRADPPTFTVLHNFTKRGDGGTPVSGLVLDG